MGYIFDIINEQANPKVKRSFLNESAQDFKQCDEEECYEAYSFDEILDEALDESTNDDFTHALYRSIVKTIKPYIRKGIDAEDISYALSFCETMLDDDDELYSLFNEALDESTHLSERQWNLSLQCGPALRRAISGEDGEEVLRVIKLAYQELLDKGLIDEDDFDSWTSEFDFLDASDEEAIDYELSQLYDACDNLGVWIPLDESLNKPNKCDDEEQILKEGKMVDIEQFLTSKNYSKSHNESLDEEMSDNDFEIYAKHF